VAAAVVEPHGSFLILECGPNTLRRGLLARGSMVSWPCGAVTMTIAVGARFANGIVLGADSRLTTPVGHSDGYAKLHHVLAKQFAFAVAGDLQLATPISDQPILDLPQFILAFLDNNKIDRADGVRDCFDQQKRIADMIAFNDLRQQALVVWNTGTSWVLWKLSRIYSQGQLGQVDAEVTAPAAGIGQFVVFETFQRDRSKIPDVALRRRLETLPPPPRLPQQPFPSEQEAIDWVAECIRWCCLGFDDCGGSPRIVRLA
jgi:hypothetical protein